MNYTRRQSRRKTCLCMRVILYLCVCVSLERRNLLFLKVLSELTVTVVGIYTLPEFILNISRPIPLIINEPSERDNENESL